MGGLVGTLKTASLSAAAVLGRRQGDGRAQRATARRKPRSENRCAALGADPEKDAPDVTPKRGGGRFAEKISPTKHFAAFHRAASRLKDGKPAVGVAPVRCTLSGPLLVAVEREPSPIRIAARFDSPAKS